MSNPRPPQNLIEYCTDDPNNNDIKAIMSAYAIRLLVDSVKTFWQNAQSIGNGEDLNNYYEPGLYRYDSNEVTNAPVVDTDGHVGYLWVIRWTDRVKQIVFVDDFTSSNRSMYERQMLLTIDGSGNVTNINASAWSFIGNTSDDPNTNNDYNTLTSSAIHALMDNIKTFWERAEYAVGVDINQSVYSEPGLWRINGDGSPASQNLPENQDGFLWTIRQESFIAQVWFNARKDAGDLPKIYIRKIVDTTNNTWSAWRQVAFQDQLDNIHTIYEQAYHTLSSQNVDMNNIINPGIYYVNADQSGYTYSNVPIHEDALMIVYRYSSYIKQMWLSTEGGHDDRIYTRFSTNTGSSWSSWKTIATIDDINNIQTFWQSAASLPNSDLNNILSPGLYRVPSSGITHVPQYEDGFLWVMISGSYKTQVWFNAAPSGSIAYMYVRKQTDSANNTWSSWYKFVTNIDLNAVKTFWKTAGAVPSDDFNNIVNPGLYTGNTASGPMSNAPDSDSWFFLWVQRANYGSTLYVKQVFYGYWNDDVPKYYVRDGYSNDNGSSWSWSSWVKFATIDDVNNIRTIYKETVDAYPTVDLNDLTSPGIYYYNPNWSGSANYPIYEQAHIIVTNTGGHESSGYGDIIQLWMSFDSARMYRRRKLYGNSWTAWEEYALRSEIKTFWEEAVLLNSGDYGNDLNNVKSPGLYMIDNGGGSWANYPSGIATWAFLHVMSYANNHRKQILYEFSNASKNVIMQRDYWDALGTWTDWQRSCPTGALGINILNSATTLANNTCNALKADGYYSLPAMKAGDVITVYIDYEAGAGAVFINVTDNNTMLNYNDSNNGYKGIKNVGTANRTHTARFECPKDGKVLVIASFDDVDGSDGWKFYT